MHRRMVAAFLTALDGPKGGDGIVVLGAPGHAFFFFFFLEGGGGWGWVPSLRVCGLGFRVV